MIKIAAVITGDLVASTKQTAEQVDAAMVTIRDAAAMIETWQAPPSASRFTRYRGDGWQIVLAEPRYALRAAVVIQARLIALGMESRLHIGIGTVDSLGTTDLSDAAGEAFELSGRGLDDMGSIWRFGLSKNEVHKEAQLIVVEDQLIADLIAERIGKWTPAQAEAAALQLASPVKIKPLYEIGKVLGISPQAVNDRVRGAGTSVIASVLQRWEGLKPLQGWEDSK